MFEIKKNQRKYYCSDQCRYAYLYENRDKWACPLERISKCEYCGEEFDNWRNPNRKYCCQAHYFAARYGFESEEEIKAMPRDDKVEWALQRKSEGLNYKEIAEELGMSHDTVKSWGRRYGDKCPTELEVCATDQFDEMTDFEPESGSIEVCELPRAAMRRIFLVCGTASFRGKYDNFASQVPQMLAYNLQTGDVFVFCNRSRHQLSVLQWQGDGFVLMFRRTEKERYPWPGFFDLTAVEITRSDLEMLIEYPRFIRRLRGLPTPDFLSS